MRTTKNLIYTLVITLLVSTVGVQAQLNRVNERQVGPVLQRLETRTDAFRTAVERQMNNRWRNSQNDDVMAYVEAFENATDELRQNFSARTSQNSDVTAVLNYGWYVNDFMSRNRLNAATVQQWNLIRTDLNTLARLYNVSWNWNQRLPAFSQNQNQNQGQMMPVRVNEQQVRGLLQRLESRTNAFKSAVERQMNNRWRNSQNDDVMAYVEAFENATNDLRSNFDGRNAQNSDVTAVMNYGWYINDFMSRNRLNAPAVQQWNLIRSDLNQLAGLYNVAWNWNQTLPPFNQGQMQPVRVNEQQVRMLLQQLETRTNAFRSTVERQMNNPRNNVRMDENALAYIEGFEQATDNLRSSFNGRTVQNSDIAAVMNYGWYVDDFMSRNRLNAPAVQQWNQIRTDLNTLSNLYNVSWNWNQRLPAFQQYPGQWGSQQGSQLDGTYRLNVAASDNVSNVISQTIRNTSVRAQQQANLERRMASPDTIAIQTSGNQIRFATDYGAPVDFVADGRAVTEANNRGQQVRTTVSMTGSTLNIMTDGDRSNDFRVSFTPVAGNRLQVTRQIYMENQNQLITVNSVYDRIANVAQWPNVSDGRPTWSDTASQGNFFVPNGMQLTAVLQQTIGTRDSQAGDQFTMTVTSPNQYRGAIITGRIAEVEASGRVSGRANLAMEFESIRFQNQTYRFAGIIDAAREADGEAISVNNEGTVRDRNQTTQTVTRAGIGAALGALIGAIAGGGQGAAIGAGIGAGAGAGTVLIQGRDNLRLEAGSQFTITSTGPNTTGNR